MELLCEKEKFDNWHARNLINRINNRSGDLMRQQSVSTHTWGQCCDSQLSRLKVLFKSDQLRDHQLDEVKEKWQLSQRKIIAIFEKRVNRERYAWSQVDYRQCFQINNRVYKSKTVPKSNLWFAKIYYEVLEINSRTLRYTYTRNQRLLTKWSLSFERAFKKMKKAATNPKEYHGRESDLWALCFRNSNFKLNKHREEIY